METVLVENSGSDDFKENIIFPDEFNCWQAEENNI